MIDYNKPPLGYLVRAASSDLDSPLDLSGRERAEAAAQFLSYERIGLIVSMDHAAAIETAEIIAQNCGASSPATDERLDHAAVICGYLLAIEQEQNKTAWLETQQLPCVLVLSEPSISQAVQLLCAANVCKEIVGPGGIISVHRVDEKIVIRARTMILDFSFTECAECVAKVQHAGS